MTAGAAASWALTKQIESPGQAALRAKAPPPSIVSAPVERRGLRETLVLSGKVSAATTVAVRLAPAAEQGDPVITARPLRAGADILSGSVVAEISGRPVVALPGSVPMYRSLHVGDSGRDVAQLQAALGQLGLAGEPETGTLGPGGAVALARLYARIGYPAPTGLQDYFAAAAKPKRKRDPEAEPPVVLPRSEVVFITALPARLAAVHGRIGWPPPESMIELAGSRPAVHAALPAADRGKVKVGDAASFQVAGRIWRGRIRAIGPAKLARRTGLRMHDVTLATARTLPRPWSGSTVEVTITHQRTGPRALVVPVAAVFDGADGETRVAKVVGTDRTENVTVTLGPSANGFVSVRAAAGALAAGDAVAISDR